MTSTLPRSPLDVRIILTAEADAQRQAVHASLHARTGLTTRAGLQAAVEDGLLDDRSLEEVRLLARLDYLSTGLAWPCHAHCDQPTWRELDRTAPGAPRDDARPRRA